ncbi:MAG: hypothetical protein JWM57_2007 [Phycisphaerales bacterium]|nr:hypothetical protein [Phycisphaerales bacterium]
MAQPQGLNVPAIITTGLVTVLLTCVIVEGVRALYNYEEPQEEARKWDNATKSTVHRLRDEQEANLKTNTKTPIDTAMASIVTSGGKMPTTKPNG